MQMLPPLHAPSPILEPANDHPVLGRSLGHHQHPTCDIYTRTLVLPPLVFLCTQGVSVGRWSDHRYQPVVGECPKGKIIILFFPRIRDGAWCWQQRSASSKKYSHGELFFAFMYTECQNHHHITHHPLTIIMRHQPNDLLRYTVAATTPPTTTATITLLQLCTYDKKKQMSYVITLLLLSQIRLSEWFPRPLIDAATFPNVWHGSGVFHV